MDKESVVFLVAAGGWIVAVITLLIGYLERRSAREQERLAKTLDYFDGGSQRRSIGISMIEGVWIQNRRFRNILIPLIANQIVYLLLSTDSKDAHNERNLERLVMLFKAIPNLRQPDHDREDVCKAIERKYAGETKGIPVSKPTLRMWAKDLGHELPDA
jgi:hypothetical protein